MPKNYKSEAFAAIHETMEGLQKIGAIAKRTMREFDEMCLTPVEPLAPGDIHALREREGVSQEVFARFLNVKKKLVGEWERGEKKPSGPSLKLLAPAKKKGLDAIA